MARRRRSLLVLLATLGASAVLTGWAYDAVPGSGDLAPRMVPLVLVLLAGSVLSGGWPPAHRRGKRPVVKPLLTAAAVFVAFAVVGWFARLVPAVDHGVETVLRYADREPRWAVALVAVAAGVAEEVFYRGALFERVRLPVLTTTLAHAAATLPAGNVALTGAALLLGLVCGLSRRASGGWWAPALTHSGWALLMTWFTPR